MLWNPAGNLLFRAALGREPWKVAVNLLLLRPDELRADGTARLAGRRALHAREVLRVSPGDELRAGVLGGLCGVGTVLAVTGDELVLALRLDTPPPPRPGVELLLALPRPKALRRLLPAIASLGVDRLVLVNAAAVEKSYFASPVLAPESIEALLLLGAEQARDTVLPEVLIRQRFRPFVEDELASVLPAPRRLVAHPGAAGGAGEATAGAGQAARLVLAIGPEGGWVPFELALLEAAGFVPVSPGPRILRVEVAVPFLLGWLAPR